MKGIILAAGQGTRLRPITDSRPKCLVSLGGRTLLDYQLSALRAAGVEEITLVGGYRSEMLMDQGVEIVVNEAFDSTNMVASLFCARDVLENGGDDVIISYGDIVYTKTVVESVVQDRAPVSVAVDLDWLDLWRLRMEDPLKDAESLKLDRRDGSIRELGLRPRSVEEIEGQYIGLVKVRGDRASDFVKEYDALSRGDQQTVQDIENMYMTAFIQHLIDVGWEVMPVKIRGGWLEVDSLQDLRVYEDLFRSGELDSFLGTDGQSDALRPS